jgi:23S rRNA (cytosine1962-C5)-methyltransferase
VNAGGRIGRADLGARLLATDDAQEAVSIAARLDGLNTERREIELRVREAALAQAEANVALNGFDAQRVSFLDADVNASLRQFDREGQRFDAIVLDPPKFAPTVAHAERAARAYKDINRLAFKLLAPDGVLFTYSCSGGISADLFHKIVASAGSDAGVDGFITERLGGAPDHPMTLNFPEGEYLKGLVVMRR